jgi:hypothetical protein
MYELIKPLFPLSCEAAEDYLFQSYTLSRMEVNLVKDLLVRIDPMDKAGEKAYADGYGMSVRELKEFRERFGV